MKQNKLIKVDKLIKEKKIDEAQLELSKLGPEFYKNPEYLYLRGKIFYIRELYYIALDTLLIALEFEKKDKIYDFLRKISMHIAASSPVSINIEQLDENLVKKEKEIERSCVYFWISNF